MIKVNILLFLNRGNTNLFKIPFNLGDISLKDNKFKNINLISFFNIVFVGRNSKFLKSNLIFEKIFLSF